MGLETVTFISDLVITNPVGAVDPKSQGDDHIRNLKIGLKNTFPSITGAVTLSHTQINDAAQKSAANIFTSAGNTISHLTPRFTFDETDAAADERTWGIRTTAGTLRIFTATDAAPSTAVADAIVLDRAGTTVTSIALAATAITLNGVAATDFARLSTNNTYAGAQILDTSLPQYLWRSSGAAANDRYWNALVNGSTWELRAYNDALSFSNTAISITRTAGSPPTVTGITLTASAITLNGVNVTDYARLSQANTFTANQTVSAAGTIELNLQATNASDSRVRFRTNSTDRAYIGAPGASNNLITGSAVGDLALRVESGSILFSGNGGTTIHFGLSSSGVVTTPNAGASEVGYKGAPQNSQGGNYTLALTDAGKAIKATGAAATITIPNDASVVFPDGTVILIHNRSGGNITVTKTTASGLVLDAVGTTGARTLANNSVASIYKSQGDEWIISGPGVS